MHTPAGKECHYFFGDYYRGRSREECRLLIDATPPLPWTPDLCYSCPVPEIELANACQFMLLEPRLERSFPFLKRKVGISTRCSKTGRTNFDPHIGCGDCHPLPPAFNGDANDPHTAP
jgi:hypothetical protein